MNLNTDIWNEFADYLAVVWTGDFRHSFPLSIKPRHPVWADWRKKSLSDSDRKWYCGNLREASERYSWSKVKDGLSIEDVRQKLLSSISDGSAEDVRVACKAIFKWGGVARKSSDASLQWIERLESNLPQQITRAVGLLKDLKSGLMEFDGKELLMNSAMTKVYWAADPDRKLAIYDGRVGAALGLLGREFLKSRGIITVPDQLEFRWGGSRDKHISGQLDKRNPSEGTLKFPSLFGVSRKDFHHAQMMRDSSFLLQHVSTKLKNVSVHDLEQALFMIGYDVRYSGQLTAP